MKFNYITLKTISYLTYTSKFHYDNQRSPQIFIVKYNYYFKLLTHYIYNRLDEATPLFVEPSILLPVHLPTQHSLASFVYTLCSLLLYSTHDGGLNQPFLYTALLQYCSDQVLKN